MLLEGTFVCLPSWRNRIELGVSIKYSVIFIGFACACTHSPCSKSDFILSGTEARPLGVISLTSSSTVIFSNPLFLITSLQYSFNSSRQPHSINLSRRICLSLSFSPVSMSFCMMVARTASSFLRRSDCDSADMLSCIESKSCMFQICVRVVDDLNALGWWVVLVLDKWAPQLIDNNVV